MAVLLALIAAATYGVSDFLGGLASRRTHALTVLLYNYPAGALVMVALLPLFPGSVSGSTLAWSLAGGAVGLAGVGLLYSALGRAAMSVVSPITAVLSACVPVLVGVIGGERPAVLAWIGIAIGLAAVVLVSRTDGGAGLAGASRAAVLMALGAGVGFGLYFVCLARSDDDSGLWPVVIARICAAALVIPLARRVTTSALRGQLLLIVIGSGVLDAAANLAFLEASRHGFLSIASVITALYPAGTVLLAALLLGERTGRTQRIGLGLAAVAVVLVTS
ncbi:MAG: DMT family transporter [bacterium]